MSHPTETSTHFTSFAQFYPFYLNEHRNRTSRRLHFAGSLGVLVCIALALGTGAWGWWPGALLCGYGCAWIGHFFFEKNRPSTFRHPIYSLMGDWVMFRDILIGRVRI